MLSIDTRWLRWRRCSVALHHGVLYALRLTRAVSTTAAAPSLALAHIPAGSLVNSPVSGITATTHVALESVQQLHVGSRQAHNGRSADTGFIL